MAVTPVFNWAGSVGQIYIVQQIPLRSALLISASLTYLQNRGAAFSILQDQQLLFAVITLVVVIGAIWYFT